MRSQAFFNALSPVLALDLVKAEYFATDPNFYGGWEIWLQCNIGYAFTLTPGVNVMAREVCYPSGAGNGPPYLSYNAAANPQVAVVANANAAARADFLISRPAGLGDTTYVELKCRTSQETIAAAWTRFWNDVNKVNALAQFNPILNCIAMLATWGTFSAQDIQNLAAIGNARVLDFSTGNGNAPIHTTLANVAQGGVNRLFLVSVPA